MMVEDRFDIIYKKLTPDGSLLKETSRLMSLFSHDEQEETQLNGTWAKDTWPNETCLNENWLKDTWFKDTYLNDSCLV